MAQQTAMMELIDWVELRFNNPRETEIFKKATQLLEKEKEQIIDAFDTACQDQDRIGMEYYNETYKQD